MTLVDQDRIWPLAALAIWIALSCLYMPHVRTAGFVYEDEHFATAQELQPHPAFGWRRGLTRWAWSLAPTPPRAHALSLGLHMIVALLVGLLMWRLSGSHAAALAAAALFALHPLTIEAFAYAAERGELIAAIGVLIACLSALTLGRYWWIGAAFGAAIGIAGKESAIVLMALLPLLWRDRRLTLASAALMCAAVLYAVWPSTGGELQRSSVSWALLQTAAVHRLAFLSLLPYPGSQTVDFDYAILPQQLQIESALLLVGAVALAGWLWARRPIVAIGIAWAVIAVLPRLLVQTPISILNEHQWYLPMIGVSLSLASLICGEQERSTYAY